MRENENQREKGRLFPFLLSQAALFGGMLAAGYGITAYSGRILRFLNVGGSGNAAAILAQLENADIRLHWLVPLLLTLLHEGITLRRRRQKGGKGPVRLRRTLIFLAGVLSCVLLTSVNGIRTGDLLRLLARLLRNGLTEVL